ncbi:MAG: O-fucosyltransferase family protein [Acidobacteria bacterium]|nr:O-fucosyltransferase family protein [Acidobacteriota bacterium]
MYDSLDRKAVRLSYGPTLGCPEFARPMKAADSGPARYLTFDTDSGGWNNILMHFEIMVVLAWLTGRTIIVPPATRLYLLGNETLGLLDFFDRESLEKYLDVLTPREYAASEGFGEEFATHERFHQHISERGYSPGWNAMEDALAHPPHALTARFELIPRLLGRRPVGIVGEADTCEILYFPASKKHRMFGVAEAFFLFADPLDERRSRSLIRDAIRYRPEIMRLAEAALQSPALAGLSFGAMHIRRGDFQYDKTQISAESIVAHMANLFSPGQTIYVATDEQDLEFLQPVRERYDIVTLGQLDPEVVSAIPHHWSGIVETLICAAAPERFVGTRLSTFSARISILRGHMSLTPGSDLAGIDTALYYTQPPLWQPSAEAQRPYGKPLAKHVDEFGETDLPWWESRRHVPVWGRAYKAVWAETIVDED